MVERTGAPQGVMIKILNHLHIIPGLDFRSGAPSPSLVRLRDSSGLAHAGSISLCSLPPSYSVELPRIFKKSSHAQANPILAFSPSHRSSSLPKKATRHAEPVRPPLANGPERSGGAQGKLRGASAVSSGKQIKQILRFAQDDVAQGVFQQRPSDQSIPRLSEMPHRSHPVLRGLYKASPTAKVAYQGGLL